MKNKTNSLKFPNIDYFLKKVIGESRGVWDAPHYFDKDGLQVCRCCVDFADTGRWPSRTECNWPSVEFDEQCVKRIDGSPGYGTFDYTESGKDEAGDILYMLDHWGEPWYPADCISNTGCLWGGWAPWPYWEDAGPCCLEDGTCTECTPFVCGLHMGDPGGTSSCEATGSCCFQNGNCEELTKCKCEKKNGAFWDEGSDCGPNNPCGPAAPTDKRGGK